MRSQAKPGAYVDYSHAAPQDPYAAAVQDPTTAYPAAPAATTNWTPWIVVGLALAGTVWWIKRD